MNIAFLDRLVCSTHLNIQRKIDHSFYSFDLKIVLVQVHSLFLERTFSKKLFQDPATHVDSQNASLTLAVQTSLSLSLIEGQLAKVHHCARHSLCIGRHDAHIIR